MKGVEATNVISSLVEGLDRLEGVNLFPHQADGVSFLLSKKRAILGDDMGLGKTRQAIAAMQAGLAVDRIVRGPAANGYGCPSLEPSSDPGVSISDHAASG